MLNECRPGAARIFEDRGGSKCPWETIIRFRVVFVSQSNQLDHTELTELVWVTFRGIYFRRLFHLGAAVLWQRFPDSPRPALIMIYLYLLNIPLIFKSSRQSFGRLGFLRLLPAVRMLRDHSSVQMAIWDLRSWSAGHFSSERRFKTFGEDLKTCSICCAMAAI